MRCASKQKKRVLATFFGFVAALLAGCGNDNSSVPDTTTEVPPLACSHRQHELPIVTHWNANSRITEYLASDNAIEEIPYQSQEIYQTGCHARWRQEGNSPFFPQYQSYLGSNYALESVSDADVNQWSEDVCNEVGQPIKIVRPDVWSEGSIDLQRVQQNAPYIQLIHGVQVSGTSDGPGSLASIVLPRNWSPTPAKPYPVVAMSYYDLNFTTFRVPQGRQVIDVIASSTEDGRSGAIGVIFNGNAGAVGYTNNENAYRDFGKLIDNLAVDLAADRDEVVVFGGSRGGSSAINFAANPFDLDYTVRFAAAGASATHFSRLMSLVPSFTYPRTAEIVSEVTGFHDAWRPGWVYPDCGLQKYRGQSAIEVVTDVIFGAPADAIDALSPYADANIQRLLASETGIYMSIGRNDVLPAAAQLDFAQKMLRLGVNAEVTVVARGGHSGLRDAPERARDALFSILDGGEIVVDQGLHQLVADHGNNAFLALQPDQVDFGFTMEAPRVVARGIPTPWVFSGMPGTEFRASLQPPSDSDSVPLVLTGSIPDELDNVFSVNSLTIPETYPAGDYAYALEIRKPGQEWITINSRNTPSANGTEATLFVPEELPDVSGGSLSDYIESLIPESSRITGAVGWRISEY